MMANHSDKAIIVTGGAGAIGFATAKLLASEGARVMLVDINGEGLEARRAEFRELRIEVEAICADCSQEEAVERYADAAVKKFGRIDGFFNNAGTEGNWPQPGNMRSPSMTGSSRPTCAACSSASASSCR